MSADPQAAKLVANERVKLLANNLDPRVVGLRHGRRRHAARGLDLRCQRYRQAAVVVSVRWPHRLALGRVPPTLSRETRSERSPAVNEYALLAFVIAPAAVVALGYLAVRLQERETARVRREIADAEARQSTQPAIKGA